MNYRRKKSFVPKRLKRNLSFLSNNTFSKRQLIFWLFRPCRAKLYKKVVSYFKLLLPVVI